METEKIREELAGSLDKILDYAGCDERIRDDFKANIAAYKSWRIKTAARNVQ